MFPLVTSLSFSSYPTSRPEPTHFVHLITPGKEIDREKGLFCGRGRPTRTR